MIRDLPRVASSWRSTQDLSSYLRDAGVVGICGIDTRKLTRILRENGAQNGCVMAGAQLSKEDDEEALRSARAAPSMAGLDLAKVVSCTAPYEWAGSTWALGVGVTRARHSTGRQEDEGGDGANRTGGHAVPSAEAFSVRTSVPWRAGWGRVPIQSA